MSSPTDQQILDALRTAYFNIATAGAKSYTAFGRTFEKYDLDELQQSIAWFERRIDAVSQPGIGGGTVLVFTNGL